MVSNVAAASSTANNDQAVSRLDPLVDEFAYAASHDLQEPLRMVKGYLSFFLEHYGATLDPAGLELLMYVSQGTDRLQEMINDLLDFSRVQSRLERFRPVSLDEPYQRAMDALRLSVKESGATVTHDPLPMVTCDPAQIARLFQNLIGNALKFRTAEAAPQIHVSARRGMGAWTFSVTDNGIGFDPRQANSLFRPFRRLQPADKYPGTGMGLAICKKIVELHDGRIWAEARPGKGATFSFTLPDAR